MHQCFQMLSYAFSKYLLKCPSTQWYKHVESSTQWKFQGASVYNVYEIYTKKTGIHLLVVRWYIVTMD